MCQCVMVITILELSGCPNIAWFQLEAKIAPHFMTELAEQVSYLLLFVC